MALSTLDPKLLEYVVHCSDPFCCLDYGFVLMQPSRLKNGEAVIWDRLKTMGNKNGNLEGDPELKWTSRLIF